MHQDSAVFGVVLDAGREVKFPWWNEPIHVAVWFNPHQLSGETTTKDGVTIMAIDQEAVLGMASVDDVQQMFDVEFTLDGLDVPKLVNS